MNTKKHLSIPYEVADGITLANLKDYRSTLKKELNDNKKGAYMHSEDIPRTHHLVACLDTIISSFGG